MAKCVLRRRKALSWSCTGRVSGTNQAGAHDVLDLDLAGIAAIVLQGREQVARVQHADDVVGLFLPQRNAACGRISAPGG